MKAKLQNSFALYSKMKFMFIEMQTLVVVFKIEKEANKNNLNAKGISNRLMKLKLKN